MSDILTMGIDIGSSSSKAVVMKNGTEILASHAEQLGTGSSGPRKLFDKLEKDYGYSLSQMDRSIVTGYGRINFEMADRQVSEITCQARGVHFLIPTARTIIDIGGQDVKVIAVDSRGFVQRFFMNDKCAAGTGRFLEAMARILEMDVSELADYGREAEQAAAISSTCTVFAESEVISRLSAGEDKRNIVAGIHDAVASKVSALVYRCGIKEDVVLTGGVAQNDGVLKSLEKILGIKVYAAPMPQMTAAIGAALIAYEDSRSEDTRQTVQEDL